MNIILLHDGTIKTIGKPPFNLPVRTLSKRRVSTITPMWAPKKQAFWLLRKIFGDDGLVAAYTRTWNGPWLVRIIATGEWSVFNRREFAVDWEMEQLNGDAARWDL